MCFRALLFTLVGLFCLLFHHSPVSGNDDAVCTGGGGRCYCCLVHVASVLSIPAISTCNTAGGFLRLGPWGQAGSAEVHTQGGGPHHWGWLSCFPLRWGMLCAGSWKSPVGPTPLVHSSLLNIPHIGFFPFLISLLRYHISVPWDHVPSKPLVFKSFC